MRKQYEDKTRRKFREGDVSPQVPIPWGTQVSWPVSEAAGQFRESNDSFANAIPFLFLQFLLKYAKLSHVIGGSLVALVCQGECVSLLNTSKGEVSMALPVGCF